MFAFLQKNFLNVKTFFKASLKQVQNLNNELNETNSTEFDLSYDDGEYFDSVDQNVQPANARPQIKRYSALRQQGVPPTSSQQQNVSSPQQNVHPANMAAPAPMVRNMAPIPAPQQVIHTYMPPPPMGPMPIPYAAAYFDGNLIFLFPFFFVIKIN